MGHRSVYEAAFEHFLRARRVPFLAVDDARRALLPEGAAHRAGAGPALKSFDVVVYGRDESLLVDVKGRKIPRRAARAEPTRGRLESWVTRDDVESLDAWRRLFGAGFDAAFVFLYWCDEQPPDGLFQEVFEHGLRWYAVRAVRLDAYREHMVTRSERWGTVHVPSAKFESISQPFCPAPADQRGGAVRTAGRPSPALQPHEGGLSSV